MEVHVPILIPDSTIKNILMTELEKTFMHFNQLHGSEEPTSFFSQDPEEEKKLLEDAMKACDLIHGIWKEIY